MLIHFNDGNDINQFEKDNPLIDLLVIDNNNKPLFLTSNNVTIVKLNDHRYSLCKPTLQCFNNNINGINTIYATTLLYVTKLTDKIKEDLRLNI